ncbi:MAG: TetR/AcrR family transcriptional regulator [Paenibacillus dendritiformis]|uniref:TetR/AcrR family transcriptional regulator n=1 Tax=Paenibacillus dendritiformis TaxID=130049 RepID=UPI00143CD1C2|nr:TetR/AcrR family transcriptional regulator [Paenibacillus dendritiformis]MDU5141112.1 TetR/AcrR family transcriptional regulator [Paenibacillus dendritiformis]NKI20060.1 TetR/AcrR family transcriptional regulator [Paenibacillus dendritiformis]NRF98299.1 TetR/AcrR family transcriptional regulator [Paenibacillus dendritiformis]GIO74519.1 fatty acid metabolism regulator protein [Paenibacillus dendritiformis]
MASQKKEKYSQILEAAVKVFAEHGFHRSQVSRIAKTAGVADGTIYLYFKRKEDILISLFREKLGELIGKFHASLEETTGAKEALRKVCEIHFTELGNNPDLAFVTQIELRQSSLELRKEIGKIIKPYIVLIEKIIVQGIEEKVFRADLDVKLTRLLIFGSMDEVVTSWLISGQKYSLIGQLDGTVGFFLKGLEA